MSWYNFQQLYILVAPLRDEKNYMQIFKHLYCHWDWSPKDPLAELEISVWD
jgi:hypothetical protein